MIELLLSLAWSSFIWVFFFGCDMYSDLEHKPERCAPLIPVECCHVGPHCIARQYLHLELMR
jgi:hypothetical protein